MLKIHIAKTSLPTAAKKTIYGVSAYADEKARIVENQLQGLHLHINGQDLYSRLVGDFNASNLMAAFCVTRVWDLIH